MVIDLFANYFLTAVPPTEFFFKKDNTRGNFPTNRDPKFGYVYFIVLYF